MTTSHDYTDPQTWLDATSNGRFVVDAGELTRPNDPAVIDAVEILEIRHHIVDSLAALRREGARMTQTDLATAWGRAQPQISTIESRPERSELATLASYVGAMGGTLTITATVNNYSYTTDIS
jgi:hypothetical protein